MVNAKAAIGKKRSATTKIHSKPAKTAKKAQIEEDQEEKQSEGLFDNLDEEMDPALMDDIMDQINESEEEEADLEEDDEEEDDAEENDAEEEDAEDDEEVEEEDNMEEDEQSEDLATTSEQKSTAKRFRDSYMTKVTQAFGSDLDTIRQEPNLNGPRLNILIDSLEAGIDIFSALEQEIILADEEK